ncbi:Hypothetical protein ETEE_3122 [Edwardsiella anguillarum ET080813]|uniref:Uncharacterized protein n=1 Tax=Edwardsiella anguillarum ET080813 TaxID=667120 RepID=A0A076LNV9_9GAMM|nr:Hypothetical protein ETEE_3122 [Edwardsiella anguillarum ET080813]
MENASPFLMSRHGLEKCSGILAQVALHLAKICLAISYLYELYR